jgi:transcriptional repressor NrdR
MRALEKRPVGLDQVEELVGAISKKLKLSGEREVTAKQIGQEVMDGLRVVDEVAYIRYVSVYLSFEDVTAFSTEVERLRSMQGAEGEAKQLSLLKFIRRNRRQGNE